MKAILWCNGANPNSSILDEVLSNDAEVFGVDGGADKAAEEGVVVSEILGDLDSVDITRWEGRVTELIDQNNSDLAKAIGVLTDRGYTEIDVIGTEGGATSHVLGNWAALCDAPSGARIRIHHNDSVTSRFHPDDGEMEFLVGEGEVFYLGSRVPASRALKDCGLKPLNLAAKEGLALINGTQFSTACALVGLFDALRNSFSGIVSSSLSTDAIMGSTDPLTSEIHELRDEIETPSSGAKVTSASRARCPRS